MKEDSAFQLTRKLILTYGWNSVFAISNEPRFSFRTLYAIASAFSNNAPVRLFLSGLWRAILMELKWIRKKILSRNDRKVFGRFINERTKKIKKHQVLKPKKNRVKLPK